MNIQLLLSANQGQNPLSSAPAQTLESKTTQPIFHQALMQAADSQSQRLTSSPTESNPIDPLANFTELLTSLDLGLDKEALTDLLAQLQAIDLNSSHQTATKGTLSEAATLTPLDEIAARLSLVATFTETAVVTAEPHSAAQVHDIAQQITISESQATELLAAFNAVSVAAPQGTSLATLHKQISSLLSSRHSNEINNIQSEYTPANSSQKTLNLPSIAYNMQLIDSLPVNKPQQNINLSPNSDSQQPASFSLNNMVAPVDINASSLRVVNESPSSIAALAELMPGVNRSAESPLINQLASGTSAATGQLTSATIGTPVNSPAWPSQLSQQLIQIAQRGGEHQIKMQLHPAELGPLSISLKVSEHGAQAHFLSTHAQVRQVLELAIPQLREALAEQGISLGETSVGEHNNPNDQSFAQHGTNASSGEGNSTSKEDNEGIIKPSEDSNALVSLDGRVDLYA